MISKPYQITRACDICQGAGKVYGPYCAICHFSLAENDPWWQSDDDLLPCGHDADGLVEWVICATCAGDGRVQQYLTQAEWQARRRRKMIRAVFCHPAFADFNHHHQHCHHPRTGISVRRIVVWNNLFPSQENPMTKRLILVAGNIGAGKTSLTERIGDRLGWQTAYESVADNPYLADFYGDMRQWAFHLQVFFLGHRAEQHLELAQSPGSAIADRSIYEDAHIFARALYHMGNVSERDYHSYRRLFDLVVNGLPRPDLLLYLKAPVSLLLERIRQRGREAEAGITTEYLSLLDSFYDEWLQNFDLCPVLSIPGEKLDFVNQPQHLDIVVQRILDKLAGKEVVVFPEP